MSASVTPPVRPASVQSTSLEDQPIRTGIFVYATTIVTITTLEDGLKLAVLNGAPDLATLARSNQLTLQPGIYRVLSMQPITVTGGNLEVQSARGKDPFPDLQLQARTLLGDTVTQDAVDAFFASKSISV